MPQEAESQIPPAACGRVPHDRQTDLEDMLFTLAICQQALPWDTHPDHINRLQRIEQLVRWGMAQQEGKTLTRGRDTASCPEENHDLAY